MSGTPSRAISVFPAGSAQEDLSWIGWIRFVAICAVVGIHSVASTAILPEARSTRYGMLAIAIDIGSTWAVPVFVMLSGAMILDPAKFTTAGTFLRKRAARLVPAIVFWHLFYAAFGVWVLGRTWDPVATVRAILNGELATALYFFWIVLGLAAVSPLVIPWLREAGRKAVVIAAALGCLIPILTLSTYRFRQAPLVWVDTPWTWWIPYFGLFLMGWALRGVVLRGWVLWLCLAGIVVIGTTLTWQWKNPSAPDVLQILAPVSYYGASVQLQAMLIYLAAQSLIRPQRGLGALARPRIARVGRTLGDATMGVFAMHIAVLALVVRYVPVVGGRPAVKSSALLVARWATVLVTTYLIVLVGRRVPVVRAVL